MLVRTAKARLSDIADRAQVSVSAVSLALADSPRISPATKQRIRRISRELNYRQPGGARGAARREGMQMGLLLMSRRLKAMNMMPLLQGLMQACNQRGHRLEVAAIEQGIGSVEARRQALAFAGPLDGLLLSGLVEPALLDLLEAKNLAHLVIGHATGTPNEVSQVRSPSLGYDFQEIGLAATRRLLAAGHRRIGFACESVPPGMSHAQILQGCRIAHWESGLSMDPALIYISSQVPGAARGPEAVCEAVRRWAGLSERPTACMVPGPESVIHFRQLQRELEWETLVVTQSSGPMDEAVGTRDCALMVTDNNELADMAIRQLQQLVAHPCPYQWRLSLPYALHQFPSPLDLVPNGDAFP